MLWTCLRFPSLPLEVFRRGVPHDDLLLVVSTEHRPRVAALSPRGREAGIRPGMALVTALALAPHAVVQPRSTTAEQAALAAIAGWAIQFTPTVSLAPPDAVLAEIGGSLRLFGGLEALARRIATGLRELGYDAVAGTAPTPAGALLLARAGMTRPVTTLERLARTLAPLPLALLDAPPATVETLAETGIETLGACLALPRDGLARRFGQALLDSLDRMLGRLPDPRPPFEPPQRYAGRIELPSPVHDTGALLFAARRLVAELCGWLAGRGLGVMRLAFELVHEDCAPTRVTLNLSSPNREPEPLVRLVRERFGTVTLPGRVEAIRLESLETARLASRDRNLFGGDAPAAPTDLVDRLCARLGDDAVLGLAQHADHRPERVVREAPPHPPPATSHAAPRPLWLLAEPRPVTTAAVEPLVLMDGPERIESGWWDGSDVRRDYFVARAADGSLLWVYRERDAGGRWFVQGVFA